MSPPHPKDVARMMRLARANAAPSRPKRDSSIAQLVSSQRASFLPYKTSATFTAEEALMRSSALADQIPAVVEQMKFHKKQARRLAELASSVYDAVDSSIPKPPPEDTPEYVRDGLDKLIRVLYRIEERLRDVGSGNLVTRMNELPVVQHDLMELEDECVKVAKIFEIKVSINVKRTEKAKLDDELALKDLATNLEKDPEVLADKIGLRGDKLDEESRKSLQIMLYSIEHSPHKVPPEFRSFAESAARTIYSRTKQEISHDLPWHVRKRDFKFGDRIGDGGFSKVYQATWLSRGIQVAVKVFEDQGENIDRLIKEIVIWKDHEHPCLLKFFASCVLEKPKFIVSSYCKNGNALDYLELNPDHDRAKILLDISRGMLYLHSAKIVHGDLKARNVLISDEGRALVADFGLAEYERNDIIPSRVGSTPSGTSEKTPRVIGTPHWLAPECFKDITSDRKFADVWAMGMTSYELYENGKVPLGHIPTAKLSDKLEAGERPPRPSSHHVPDYVWKEMETCWSLNIIDRPSFSEITLVLGIFQNPELETLQEIRHALGEQQTFLHSLIKYPGFLERLVQILMVVSRVGPTESRTTNDSTPGPQLSPAAEQQVILALSILEDFTSVYMDDDLQMQVICDAGILTALLKILTSQDEFKKPEIIAHGCQIIANVMRVVRVMDSTARNNLAQGDFIDALLELIGSPDPKVATHAMSTLRTLLNSNSWLATHDEQLVQKKRVMEGGIIPKLLTVCKRVKEANPLRECLRLLAQMGMEPTSLEEGDVKGICPVLMDLAGSDVPLQPRQCALEALNDIAAAGEPQTGYVRSCGLFEKLFDHLQGGGMELFSNGCFTGGVLLSCIAEEEHIPSILKLLQKSDPPHNPMAPSEEYIRLCTKQSACLALAAIGDRIPTPEERWAVAHRYPVFNVLQPLLSATDDGLVTCCREALALYSSVQDFPVVLEHLKDESFGPRLMATQICVTLVAQASDDNKIAAAGSGILPALKAILDDPPSPTEDDSDSDDGPPPLIPSRIMSHPSTSCTNLPRRTSSARAHYRSSLIQMIRDHLPKFSNTPAYPNRGVATEYVKGPIVLNFNGSAGQRRAIEPHLNPNATAKSSENGQLSRVEESGAVPSIKAGEGNAVHPPELASDVAERARVDARASNEPVSTEDPEGNVDTTHVSAMAGGTKQSRSPGAKSVTFDSVDHIIVVDTETDADKAEPGTHENYEKVTEKAGAAEAAKTEAKSRKKIYRQAYAALEHILTVVSKSALDTIGMAYIAADIHKSLTNAIDDKRSPFNLRLTCLEMLHRMSMSTDEVRLEMVCGELLRKLRSIMGSEREAEEARQCACDIVHTLLSEEGDEVMDAVVDADFVPALAKFMNHEYIKKTHGAEVLSQLILEFNIETPEELVVLAISTLNDYCKEAPENMGNTVSRNTFRGRMYFIVEYLRHPLAKVCMFGLALTSSFTKGSLDDRRTLENLGFRNAIEDCCRSNDEEISSVAKEILENFESKRGSSRKLRAPRRSS